MQKRVVPIAFMRQLPRVTGMNEETTADLRATLEKTLGDVYSFERELGRGGMSRGFRVRLLWSRRAVTCLVASSRLHPP